MEYVKKAKDRDKVVNLDSTRINQRKLLAPSPCSASGRKAQILHGIGMQDDEDVGWRCRMSGEEAMRWTAAVLEGFGLRRRAETAAGRNSGQNRRAVNNSCGRSAQDGMLTGSCGLLEDCEQQDRFLETPRQTYELRLKTGDGEEDFPSHLLHGIQDGESDRQQLDKEDLERQASGLESKKLISDDEISNLSRRQCEPIDLDSHLENSTNNSELLESNGGDAVIDWRATAKMISDKELATKMKENLSIRCQLDDVPVQTELIQYVLSLFHFTFPLPMVLGSNRQLENWRAGSSSRIEDPLYERRFSELYAQIQEKHHVTRRHYTTYNALLEIKELMLKEASLLNSINLQSRKQRFKNAMTTPSGRSKFLDTMEAIVKGAKHTLHTPKTLPPLGPEEMSSLLQLLSTTEMSLPTFVSWLRGDAATSFSSTLRWSCRPSFRLLAWQRCRPLLYSTSKSFAQRLFPKLFSKSSNTTKQRTTMCRLIENNRVKPLTPLDTLKEDLPQPYILSPPKWFGLSHEHRDSLILLSSSLIGKMSFAIELLTF
ncbi:hypothetical protein M5K25_015762 [Dendrobium thyrsiflorum]|uniref:CCDC93 coiled-coil domain-containing protein n=1 Tax=Dendrobium thyrsiflorum TaxID=117978 RepID=A0ABD0US22_DENTH